MSTSALRALFQLPPEQAIKYLESKGMRLSWNWWEMQREAHSRAFTVAKLARLDILQDIRAAVETALKEGQTEAWFRKELEDTLKKKGWWGKQVSVDPITGEAQLYQAGSARRLQTIYRTNLQTAYMAGRQKQFDKEKDRAPFVQYLAVLDSRTRPAHEALHSKVFRLDDPAWDLISPPNGFNCRCRARNLSQRELDARGLKVQTDTKIHAREPQGKRPIDPRTGETPADWTQRGVSIPDPASPGDRLYLWPDVGWDYNPGRAGLEQLEALAKRKEEAMGLAPTRLFEAQKTAAAAAKWAVDNDLVDYADFGGVKPEVANAWNQSLFEHVTQFPELRAQQKFVGSAQAQFKRWREIEIERQMVRWRAANPGVSDAVLRPFVEKAVKRKHVSGTHYAHSWMQADVSGIAVNTKWGRDPDGFLAAIRRDMEANWHPQGAASIKAVVDHEMGHQLDALLNLATDAEVVAIWDKGPAHVRDGLSRYATVNIKEMIAEAWTEYRNSPTPRPIARAIGEIIERRYASRYP